MHLGMTGRFEIEGGEAARKPGRFAQATPADPRHAHVVFETEAGVRVTYFDARRFGYMDLVATDGLDESRWFKGLGPEPLGPAFDADHLARAFAGRRQAVKSVMLDQRAIAGLGNIYVCEALHRAGLAPSRPAGSLKGAKLTALAGAIRTVLEEAIEAGGSTLRDYAAADGSLGYFQHSFAVYGREGERCRRADCAGVIHRTVQAGRSTFACARCQT
jgi:formamidopyrimidine-DNA glycosylase